MTTQILEIPLTEIFADDDFNSRGHIDPATVADLAADIKGKGLLQPIIVQTWNKNNKKWRIVCGHRRYLAVKLLKLPTIKSILNDSFRNDAEAFAANLAENVKRSNLNILQEAMAIGRFKKWGWSTDKIAEELKISTRWVAVRLKLLNLPSDIQERAAAGFLTQHQIMDISGMATKDQQYEACRKAVDWKLLGEKGSLKVKAKVKDVFKKEGRAKDRAEIITMQSKIQDVLESNAHPMARALAWAAGVISDFELLKDVATLAKDELGKDFDPLESIQV